MSKTFIENQILLWLRNNEIRENLETKRNIINIAFHHLIRWYPQSSTDGLDIYSLNAIQKIENWKITRRAKDAFIYEIGLINNPSLRDFNKILKKTAHPEHNISVSLMKTKLLNLTDLNVENIYECLNPINYYVVLMSEQESLVLNGSLQKRYFLDGMEVFGRGMRIIGEAHERIDAVNAEIISDEEKAQLVSYLKGMLED